MIRQMRRGKKTDLPKTEKAIKNNQIYELNMLSRK